jgi:TolB protein
VADWGPAWSPEGSSIAFNSAMGTAGFGLLGYAVSPSGSRPHRLSRYFVEYPAWSPDGSRIAFMAPVPGAAGSNPDYNIFVMNADGSDIRQLTRTPGEDGWPAWSPDGYGSCSRPRETTARYRMRRAAVPQGTSVRGRTCGS